MSSFILDRLRLLEARIDERQETQSAQRGVRRPPPAPDAIKRKTLQVDLEQIVEEIDLTDHERMPPPTPRISPRRRAR
ncbi:MAG: hypothetical protein H6707_21265 [Deltaproteobacteria bacterium]|nr:hypothetical protein [Deltaproteobacteria bacterium]